MRLILNIDDRMALLLLNDIKYRAGNMGPAFRKIDSYIRDTEKKIFDSQGRRGGGSWVRDSPKWAAYKRKKKFDKRILHESRRLRKSLTISTSPDRVRRITDSELVVGTRVPYARRQNVGGGGTPARQFNRFTEGDQKVMKRIIQDRLVGRL